MKVQLVLLTTLMFSALPAHQSFAQSPHPTCQSSDSDLDGDGFGWENDQSCIVELDQGQCEDRGGYPWGWNPVTLTSCRLDEQPGTCVDTDGDGWGWDGVDSCRVTPSTGSGNIEDILVGTWLCQSQYAAFAGDPQPATGEFPNNLNGQLEWRYYELPVRGAPFPGFTVDKMRITFRADNTADISGGFEFENSFVFGGHNPGNGRSREPSHHEAL